MVAGFSWPRRGDAARTRPRASCRPGAGQAAGVSTGIHTSAARPRSAWRVSRRSRPACSSTESARSISRRFLLRLNSSENLGAGEAGGAFLGGGPQPVGGRVAERVAEDPVCGGGAIAPHGQGGLEVLWADPLGEVKQRVGQREADGVRLGAGGRGAGQAGSVGRQLAVGIDPTLAGGVVEGDRPVLEGEPQRHAHGVADLGESLGVERAAERKELGALDRDEQVAVPMPTSAWQP